MTRTRVLVLDQAVGLWGAQAVLLRLARPLADRGVDLVLAAPHDLALAQAWRRNGFEHVDLDLPQGRSVRADGVDGGRLAAGAMAREAAATLRTAHRVAAAARDAGVDALHANGHGVHLETALAGRLARLPSVVHLHEEMPQAFGRAVRTAAVGVASAAVAVSDAVAASVPGPLARRVTTVPNGVDTRELAPGPADPGVRAALGAADGDVLVVALTRLDPCKRIEDVVGALAPLVPRPGWHLAVVGETSSFPQYADAVRREARGRLGARVTFAGRREDVPAVLRAADVVVHAGLVEGMPLGLLEAGACGRPVVAYGVAGVPEAVLDGRTGLLAAGGDVPGLTARLRTLLDDDARRAALGRTARSHVAARHSLDGQADGHRAVLYDLLGRTRPGRTTRTTRSTSTHEEIPA